MSASFLFAYDAVKRGQQGQVLLNDTDLKITHNVNRNVPFFEERERLSRLGTSRVVIESLGRTTYAMNINPLVMSNKRRSGVRMRRPPRPMQSKSQAEDMPVKRFTENRLKFRCSENTGR